MATPDPEESKNSWYTLEGELVNAGLREAKKRGLLPRVSNVIASVDSGAGRFDLMAAAELAREDPGLPVVDVANRCSDRGTVSSRWGVELHDSLKRFALNMGPAWARTLSEDGIPPVHMAVLRPVCLELDRRVGQVVSCETTIFGDGYAGTIDMVSEIGRVKPRVTRSRRGVWKTPHRRIEIIDFKSMGTPQRQRKWALQFGAYADAWHFRHGQWPTKCTTIAFSKRADGPPMKVWDDWDVKACVRAWRAAWLVWQGLNGWPPHRFTL